MPIRDKVTVEELKAALKTNPQKFIMDDWAQVTDCGTAYCIAGWTLALAGYQQDLVNGTIEFSAPGDLSMNSHEIERAAKGLLGVESFHLFYTDDWPIEVRHLPNDTPEERIEQACAAIDYYMRKDK